MQFTAYYGRRYSYGKYSGRFAEDSGLFVEQQSRIWEISQKEPYCQQTDETKKQQKRALQIKSRLEQIDTVINKLYEDNALGNIEQDRYQQLSQKYTEEYYALKKEHGDIQARISYEENANERAKKFIKLTENYCKFNELTPAIINEFIGKIIIHERAVKRARQTPQYVEIYFKHIGKFENELTELAEPTEQDVERMIAEIKEAQAEKCREYHRAYRKMHRAKNIEKFREYERKKAKVYREKKKRESLWKPNKNR